MSASKAETERSRTEEDGDTALPKRAKEQQKSTADLDRVTDHVEERDMNSAALTDSMHAMMGNTSVGKKSADAKRDRELAKVKIHQADIDRIVDELELDPNAAERALREASGNLVDALCELVR